MLPNWANRYASVAELVDAADSKSVSGDRVSVRVRPEVPYRQCGTENSTNPLIETDRNNSSVNLEIF